MSLGCAAENLVQAAAAHGLDARVATGTAPEVAVEVALEPAPPAPSPLFDAIPRRQSTRAESDGRPLPTGELARLEQAGSGGGVRVQLLTGKAPMEQVLTTVLAGMAEARGGGRGGGGGGFSRSSAARGGSFSSRSGPQRSARPSARESGMGQRQAQAGELQQRASQRPSTGQSGTSQRQAGRGSRQEMASERQGQRQESASQRQEQRQTNQDERQQQRQANSDERQGYREEAREDWQDFADDEWDHDYWDDHDDWDAGAAFVVGAAAGVVAGAAAARPTYVTTLPCAGTAVVVNGASYYQCGTTWYSRGYQSGTVVYIVDSPPPGY